MRLMIVDDKNESNIKSLLQATNHFTISCQPNLHMISHQDIDVLIILERSISIQLFLEKSLYLDGIKKQFFILEEENEEAQSLCIAKGIKPILFTSEEQVVKEIMNHLYPANPKSNRLFLFVGADHKSGVTSIVHSLANELASHVQKKVMVLSLSNQPNDEFVEMSKSSLDNIRTAIATKVVTVPDLFRESEKIRNYRFLAGPRDLVGYRRYTVEEIVNLLEVLRNQDEFLVLIDGGSDVDNPLVMAALSRITNKFMVLTNRKSQYKSLDRKMKQILMPAFEQFYPSFLYLMNQYDEEVETVKEIRDRGGICAGVIPLSKFGLQAEQQELPLSMIDDGVRHAIQLLVRIIATKADCAMFEEPQKVSRLKRLFAFNKGGEIKHEFST